MSVRVLYVDGRSNRSAEVLRALREHGHQVSVARNAGQAQPEERMLDLCEVAVVDLRLEHGSALELCRALRRSRPALRVILLDPLPSLEACRAAMRAGADDYLDIHASEAELLRAVEGRRGAAPAPASVAAPNVSAFERTLQGQLAPSKEVTRLLKELTAFLLLVGCSPSVRARAVSAAGELLVNALEHGQFAGSTWVRLVARSSGSQISIEVSDLGAGLDAHVAHQALSAGEGGLARAAALVERLTLEPSASGSGTLVRLELDGRAVRWDLEGGEDLTEQDFLEPEQTKRVLATIRALPEAPEIQLSPSLALVVGRLLAGAPQRVRVEQGLWG